MTPLNDGFEWALVQEDKGYESLGESLSISTPLRRTPWIYHVSISENLSFDHSMPLATAAQHLEHSPRRFRSHKSVCHCLTFSSSEEVSP